MGHQGVGCTYLIQRDQLGGHWLIGLGVRLMRAVGNTGDRQKEKIDLRLVLGVRRRQNGCSLGLNWGTVESAGRTFKQRF